MPVFVFAGSFFACKAWFSRTGDESRDAVVASALFAGIVTYVLCC